MKAVPGDHPPVRRIPVIAGACATGRGRYCRARYYHPGLQRFITEDPVEFAAGEINLYVYVDNSPTGLVDPYGLYAIIDDLLFSAGGGVVGLIGQAIGDLISGQRSGGLDYLTAFIGGAAGGEALLYTGPVGAGAIGGAITNLTRKGFNRLQLVWAGHEDPR